jgi:hypothetical protein
VNKDEFDDFVICSPYYKADSLTNAGACYLIFGGSSLQSISMTNLGSGGIKITGSAVNQVFGAVLTRAGDINNDGYADILFGTGDLVYGGASLTSFTATAGSFSGVIFPKRSITASSFGIKVSAAGDFNGDGFDDLIISLLNNQFPAVPNIIFVVYGSASLPATFDSSTLTPSTGVRYFTIAGDGGGVAVSGGVDFNKDGFDDILIGAPNTNSVLSAVHVVFDSASAVDSSVFQLGNGRISVNSSEQNGFGRTVALVEKCGHKYSRNSFSFLSLVRSMLSILFT